MLMNLLYAGPIINHSSSMVQVTEPFICIIIPVSLRKIIQVHSRECTELFVGLCKLLVTNKQTNGVANFLRKVI